jgi:hypothetical protein
MLKKYLLILTAAGAIVSTPFAGAQETQSNDQGNGPTATTSPNNGGGRHHGPADPEKRTAELTKQLNLTSDQQAKVLSALQSENSQMQALHQGGPLTPQDHHAKVTDIRTATESEIRGVLDATQQQKWDAMQARHEQRMGNRGGAAPDANSNPPAPPQ